jgi:hypothetical protein
VYQRAPTPRQFPNFRCRAEHALLRPPNSKVVREFIRVPGRSRTDVVAIRKRSKIRAAGGECSAKSTCHSSLLQHSPRAPCQGYPAARSARP